MKAPKPSIPKGAPHGTVWFGGPIEWFSITLRIVGDNLDPDEVSRLLACEPDEAHRKGEPILRKDGSVARIAKTGAWRLKLKPEEADEWDCAEALMVILRRLPASVDVWKRIATKYQIDFFVGLSMPSKNKGFEIPPEILKYLGDRGIAAGFDIYYDEHKKVERPGSKGGPPSRRRENRKLRKNGS